MMSAPGESVLYGECTSHHCWCQRHVFECSTFCPDSLVVGEAASAIEDFEVSDGAGGHQTVFDEVLAGVRRKES